MNARLDQQKSRHICTKEIQYLTLYVERAEIMQQDFQISRSLAEDFDIICDERWRRIFADAHRTSRAHLAMIAFTAAASNPHLGGMSVYPKKDRHVCIKSEKSSVQNLLLTWTEKRHIHVNYDYSKDTNFASALHMLCQVDRTWRWSVGMRLHPKKPHP